MLWCLTTSSALGTRPFTYNRGRQTTFFEFVFFLETIGSRQGTSKQSGILYINSQHLKIQQTTNLQCNYSKTTSAVFQLNLISKFYGLYFNEGNLIENWTFSSTISCSSLSDLTLMNMAKKKNYYKNRKSPSTHEILCAILRFIACFYVPLMIPMIFCMTSVLFMFPLVFWIKCQGKCVFS